MKKSLEFSRNVAYVIACLLVMQVTTAQAAMREFYLNALNGGDCYSGKYMLGCYLGVRGDWLDITDKLTIVSGPTASITVTDKGADNKYSENISLGGYEKVPPKRGSREGYLLLELKNIRGPGTMRIKMERPAFAGRDVDYVNVTIKDGTFGLSPEQHIRSINAGQSKTVEITGYGLSGVSVKPGFNSQPTTGATTNRQRIQSTASQINTAVKDSVGQTLSTLQANAQLPPEVNILSRETGPVFDKMTVEFNLRNSSQQFELDTADIFTFSKGTPPINARFGWPTIHVWASCASGSSGCTSSATSGGNRSGVSSGTTTGTGNPGGGTRVSTPVEVNLLPNINTPTLFIRKINAEASPVVLDQALCVGLIKQQEKEVDVPAIIWMVTNASDADINQRFSVSLINGNNPNLPFHTVAVNSIPARGLVSFNNWPGRPSKIKVKLMPDPRQPNNNDANQCLLTDPRPAESLLDPRPLTIRVDSQHQVHEGSRENDNDLPVNP
ncbi:hypothetical protein [Methylophilus aquaticus]|uniref:CARDB domain-containing protein n=1 Tax=Methylophilus aquaticus TaxID=1971610 RepID=A0ABT9JVC0_9PROT|nr:hypothetical protein [Methylophilus aquaticus]MDP8568518.1 hypothetical protein [Methylophilus aquaticus]